MAPELPIEVDSETGVWTTDALPMLYVPRHFFINNHTAVAEALGVDKYAEILYRAGYKSAWHWCEKEAELHGLEGVDVFEHYMKRLSQRGWGKFVTEAIDLDAGTARVRLDPAGTDGNGNPSTENRGQAYWDVNHSGQSLPSDYANMTRYELYRLEIDSMPGDPGIPDNTNPPPPGEDGAPSCYDGGVYSDPNMAPPHDDGPLSYDRRIFTLAVVNCLQYEIDTGKKLAGNVDDVPVIGFVDVFLTQPAEGKGNDKADIYGEIIGVSINDNGLREIVQLYR